MNKTIGQLRFLSLAILVVGGVLLSLQAQAQVNQSFNFTAKVTETDGSELADGVYDFSFALYASPTGGASIWSETLNAASSFSANITSGVAGVNTTTYHYNGAGATSTLRVGQYLSTPSGDNALIVDFDTGASTITVVGTDVWSNSTAINNRPFVEGGVIDIDLGTVTSLSGIDFNQTLYLEVVFNGETMRPRKTITPSLQALNADTLDGFHSTDFANLNDNSTVTGAWTFANVVNIATSSTQTALTITQDGTGDIVDFQIGTTTALAVLNDGRVQIGDYYFPSSHGSAGYILKTNASGDLYWDTDYAGSGGGSGYWATSTDNSFIYQSDTGQLVVLGNNATSAPIMAHFEVNGLSWFDDVAVSNQQLIRFYDADSSNFFALRATATMSSNYTLTLPSGGGLAGEALLTDGSGNLTWGNPSSAGTVNAASFMGQIPYYQSATNEVSATSSIFIATNSYIGIGTTSPANLLSVNGSADFDELCFGSSCITSWGSAGSIDGSGTTGYVTYWQDADTLDSEQYLSASRGGLAQDFSGSTGFVYFNSGVASASSSISTTMTDLTASSGINLNGNLLTLDNTGNWIGTLDGLEGSSLFTLADWFATSTAPQLNTLVNLSSVGNITSGTWQANTIGVSYGGTAKSSWTQYSIPYLSTSNSFGEIAIGSSTYLLAVNATGDGYEWVEASSTGTVLSQEQVDDYVNALINDLDSTHTRISITYDDANDAMDFVVDDNLANYDNSNSQFFSTTTDTLAVDYGGTGKASWTQYSIPYMASSNAYGEIAIGTSTYILAVNASGDGYEWIEASSTGTVLSQEQVDDYVDALLNDPDSIHNKITITYNDASDAMDFVVDDNLANYNNSTSQFFSTTTDILANNYGGTGQNSSSWTGFAYINNGTWNASNTISATRLDSIVMTQGENISLLNNDSNFIDLSSLSALAAGLDYNSANGQFNLTSGYIIPLTSSTTDWQITYTLVDANNVNWTSAYNQITASSSEWTQAYNWGNHATQNYFDLDGAPLAVSEGGTGKASFTASSIIIASSTGTDLSEIAMGTHDYLLSVNSAGNGYTWVDASTAGVDTKRSREEIEDWSGALMASSTGTHTLITVAYNDNNSSMDFVVDNNLSHYDNSTSQFFSTTTDILAVAYGGTGTTTVSGVRANLGLSDIYDYAINSTATSGWVWISDNSGRGRWVASTTLMANEAGTGVSKFVGTTTANFDGSFATSTFRGYIAANKICDAEFSGSHFCRTYDILVTVEQDDISSWGGSAWIAEGPPGYTSNSNDCQGWTSNNGSHMGAFWSFDSDGGGMGWLTNCAVTKPIACCTRL